MAHFVIIEDTQGDLEDLLTYCSDFCAKTSAHYAGWFGCMEASFDTDCPNCGKFIKGVNN